MKKIQLLAIILMLVTGAQSQKTATSSSKEELSMKFFIDGLMKRMTLDEKLGQLNLPGAGDITTGQAGNTDIAKKIRQGKVGGLFNIKGVEKIKEVQKLAVDQSRLKIPLLFGMDVIHGYQTVFPIPLGLSCSWDLDAIELSARIAAKEASADGICWTFSPMQDVCRDPRWGRIAEGSGEDAFLAGEIGRAMVRGYQGNDLKKNNTILSCVKHYALYGAADAGRDYNTVDMSRVRMYNEYFPAYKAPVEEGAGSIMASFNEIDGIPATGNKWLLTDVLRKQWGFKGMVVTDYTGINEMIDHGIGDLKTVSARALDAGVDMDMVGEGLLTTLRQSLVDKRVTLAQIDAACRRILEAKYKLGLFEDPFRYTDITRPGKEVYTSENRAIARTIAAKTFVLLKNEGNLLPLKRGSKIALIGPLADNRENMPGTWSVAADFAKAVSVLDGLKELAGTQTQIMYAKGSNLDYDADFEERAGMFGKALGRDNRPPADIISEAVTLAKQCDVVVAAVGESAEMSGESSSRSSIEIPQVQKDLLMALKQTGKPIVILLFTGRPLAIPWESQNFPAILNVWFPGSEAGYAIADVLFGDVNPSGKLTTTWPQSIGQVPLFYNHKNTGRPLPEGQWFQKFKSNYLDVSNEPQYPFGYGLSYTQFAYSNLTVDKQTAHGETATIKASIVVRNTGSTDGAEVVQWYLRDVVGSNTRPVMELKHFERVTLKRGESKTVSFTIRTNDLKFYNSDLVFNWEPGEFDIMAGGNSRDVKSIRISWNK